MTKPGSSTKQGSSARKDRRPTPVNPFRINQSFGRYYLSKENRQAYRRVVSSLDDFESLTLVDGEAGVGKTSLILNILAEYDLASQTIIILESDYDFEKLGQLICRRAGIEIPPGASWQERFSRRLADKMTKGEGVLLVLDGLEQIEPNVMLDLIARFPPGDGGPGCLKYLLIGRKPFADLFETKLFSRFREANVVKCRIEPLGRNDTRALIDLKCQDADMPVASIFSEPALDLISARTDGNPRMIFSVCDKVLILKETEPEGVVSPEIVARALDELGYSGTGDDGAAIVSTECGEADGPTMAAATSAAVERPAIDVAGVRALRAWSAPQSAPDTAREKSANGGPGEELTAAIMPDVQPPRDDPAVVFEPVRLRRSRWPVAVLLAVALLGGVSAGLYVVVRNDIVFVGTVREEMVSIERDREILRARLIEIESEKAALAGDVSVAKAETERARRRLDALVATGSENTASAGRATEDRLAALRRQVAGVAAESRQAEQRLTADRDRLSIERDEAVAERDQLAATEQAIVAERERLGEERDALNVANDALAGERDALQAERDSLAEAVDQLTTANDELTVVKADLTVERDSYATARNDISIERDRFAAASDALVVERDKLVAANQQGIEKRNELEGAYNALRNDQDALTAARDVLAEENAAAVAQMTELLVEREELIQTVETLIVERDSLASSDEGISGDQSTGGPSAKLDKLDPDPTNGVIDKLATEGADAEATIMTVAGVSPGEPDSDPRTDSALTEVPQTPTLIAVANPAATDSEEIAEKSAPETDTREAIDESESESAADPAVQERLFRGARNGSVAGMNLALEAGAHVRETNAEGNSALTISAERGRALAVQSLLAAGADLNGVNRAGESALLLASREGRDQVVDLLLSKGADANIATAASWTPLLHSAINGHPSIVDRLIEGGADIDARSRSGLTALAAGAWNGHIDVVSVLIDRDADLDLTDYAGTSPLMHAAWNGHIHVVGLLLDAGADSDIAEKSGWTALMKAAWNGKVESVDMLLKYGTDAEATNDDGETAVALALRQGHADAASLIESFTR